MKKILILLELITLLALCFTVKVDAADSTNPVTTSGTRIRYNVPYTLRDKNLQNRGGITFEAWASYDYAIFSHSNLSNGTPIVFESPTNKTGFITTEDEVIVRSTQANWGGWHFWQFTSSFGSNSVWFSNQRRSIGRIYAQENDRSIGIGLLGFENFGGAPMPSFIQLEGGSGSSAWMTARVNWIPQLVFPPLSARNTPFLLSE